MGVKQKIKKVEKDKKYRVSLFAVSAFAANSGYAATYAFLGIHGKSFWYITLFAYYGILAVSRFYVVLRKHSSGGHMMRRVGVLMLILAAVLLSSNIQYLTTHNGRHYHLQMLVIVSVFTLVKAFFAIFNTIRAFLEHSAFFISVRNISLADAAACIMMLERSMLTTFSLNKDLIHLCDYLFGFGAVAVVLTIGIVMIHFSGKHYRLNNPEH